DGFADVSALPAVLSQTPRSLSYFCIVGGEQTAVAKRSEVLRRVETERRGVAERSEPASVPHRPMGLRAILDDSDAQGPNDILDGRQVRRVSVEVHRNDRLDPRDRVDGVGQFGRVYREGFGIDVDQHR